MHMVEKPISGASPCDCSILPVSPKEAERVFPTKSPELVEVMDKCRTAEGDMAFCPGCHERFHVTECRLG